MKLIFHGFYTSSCKNDISAVQAVKLKITELGNTASLNDTVETIKVAEELRQTFVQVFAKYGVVMA